MINPSHETAPTQFQDIGAASLAYRHFGKEGAPPVACFQHFTGTMNNFGPIHTNRLAQDRSVIKRAPPRNERFDLNEAINEVIVMVRGAIAKNGISVSTRLMDGLAPVQGDRVQLQQVFVNLILNAIEAMSSVEDETRNLSLRTEQSQTDGILVAVHDSGPGIDPVNLDRVFEPSYTTKTSGVGMGLSIARPSSTVMEVACG